MKRKRSVFTCLVLLAAGAGSQQEASVSAEPASMREEDLATRDLADVPAPGMFDGPNEAEMFDLAELAEQYGMSIDDAIGRYGWGRNFSVLVDKLADDFPDDYAGAAIEKDGSAWIAFRADAPTFALNLIDAFNSRVLQGGQFGRSTAEQVIVVLDRGFSERELNDRTIGAHYGLFA